jgi:hypothetical protein
MSALLAMIRRLRSLWAALVRRLGAVATPPAVATTAPAPALTGAAETSSSAPVAASLSQVAAAEPVAVAVEAAPEPVRGDMSVSAAVVVAAPAEGPVRGDALRADQGPALSVRHFFAQVAAAVPGGLTVDFVDWRTARVERYFLAMSASGRAPPRGPALTEEVVLKHAFADFEWD